MGASIAGTRHCASGKPSDDAAAVWMPMKGEGGVAAFAVSDGAGSASQSRIGARIATRLFTRVARKALKAGDDPTKTTSDFPAQILDLIRVELDKLAASTARSRHDFATTLIGAISTETNFAVLQVGDGALAFKMNNQSGWQLAAWPMQGEFASTTVFVTSHEKATYSWHVLAEIPEAFVVFTDGLERLALDFKTRTAFEPFLNSMVDILDAGPARRDREKSRLLAAFLASERVTSKTDDDKTIVVARSTKVIAT